MYKATMNWQNVFECVQRISGMKGDVPQAMVLLRQEIVASPQLSEEDRKELHAVLDKLQGANLYGRISLVGRLKELLSTHDGFKAQFAEFGMPHRRP
jgi:hypothetical protein